jgi:hypothetical protein
MALIGLAIGPRRPLWHANGQKKLLAGDKIRRFSTHVLMRPQNGSRLGKIH